MFRKLLIALLLMLIIPLNSFAKIPYNSSADTSEISFSDVADNHWAKETIYRLAAQETRIFNGYPDGTFKPQKAMSRAEFVTALLRTLDIQPAQESTFPDVPKTHWASKSIGTAQELGIIESKDYGNFMPEGEITRYEVCKMMVNSIARAKAVVNDNSVMVDTKYSDVESYDQKSKRMVYVLSDAGVLEGYPDGTAGLGRTATRAELAAFIQRFIVNSEKLENIEIQKEDTIAEDIRGGVKFVGLSQVPVKMVRNIDYTDKSPLDVQVAINKVSMFKYDSSYKGEYKELLDTASTKVRYFTNIPEHKLNNANIIALEVVTTNNSGYTIPESGSYFFDVSFPDEEVNVKFLFDNYFINRALENKDGTCYWLSSDKGKNVYKYTTFLVVDQLPKNNILLSRMFTSYSDIANKMNVAHKDNFQVIGIDLTR